MPQENVEVDLQWAPPAHSAHQEEASGGLGGFTLLSVFVSCEKTDSGKSIEESNDATAKGELAVSIQGPIGAGANPLGKPTDTDGSVLPVKSEDMPMN